MRLLETFPGTIILFTILIVPTHGATRIKAAFILPGWNLKTFVGKQFMAQILVLTFPCSKAGYVLMLIFIAIVPKIFSLTTFRLLPSLDLTLLT
jgi:hypothetical protein